MQQPRTAQNNNPENTNRPTKKKKKTHNINLENTNRPTQKAQTHKRKYSIGEPTQKKQKMNQETNRSGAEIIKPMALRLVC